MSREPRTAPGDAPALVVYAGGEDAPRNLRQFLQENTPLLLGIIRSSWERLSYCECISRLLPVPG